MLGDALKIVVFRADSMTADRLFCLHLWRAAGFALPYVPAA
jgi:hypothetical protein